MPSPFLIFSWNRPFIPELKDYLCAHHAAGEIPLLITPTFRFAKYLNACIACDKKAHILPSVLPLREASGLWHASVAKTQTEEASLYDKIWLLHTVAQKAKATDSDTGDACDVLGSMNLDAFLPWGEQITALIDEILANGLELQDIDACEGEVLPAARRLLSVLGETGAEYLALLAEHRLSTRGTMARTVYTSITEGGPVPEGLVPSQQRPVYILVQHCTTKAEEAMLKALWQNGARIVLHTDPNLLHEHKKGLHWSALKHLDWMNRWQAEAEPATGDILADKDAASLPAGRMHFFAGYDLHSQLGELGKNLAGAGNDERCAVILPDASLLMPVLHHVPYDKLGRLEVALGLPIQETALCRLVESCLALQELRDSSRRYHWKELANVLDASILGSLCLADGTSMQPAIRHYRAELMQGQRFVDPYDDILAGQSFADREDEAEAMRGLLDVLVRGFDCVSSIAELAEALQRLCSYIQEHGEMLRETSPLDMEALFHMEHSLLPSMQHCLMLHEKLSLQTLEHLFGRLCLAEHIAFAPRQDVQEAEIMVMSLSEAALISFDKVYIPEATDDMLPGARKRDPLLPDSLRALLGLPALNEEDSRTAENVMRLCQSSGEVFFYWQEGVSNSLLFDGKKVRSRYVEDYIWQLEKQAGHIFTGGTEPLRQAECHITPMNPSPRSIRTEGRVKDALETVLSRPLSPSLLDDYLHCPLKFAFKRLAGLGEIDVVNEKDDPLQVGEFIHSVLENFHKGHLEETLPQDEDENKRTRKEYEAELLDIFETSLDSGDTRLTITLPPENLAFLRETGRKQLAQYVRNMPDDICPVLLEHELSSSLEAAGSTFTLKGRVDRLDRRQSGLVVLDYKTSRSLPDIRTGLWNDADFFRDAEELAGRTSLDEADRKRLDELFRQLGSLAGSIQLPTYITMGLATRLEARDLRNSEKTGWPEGDIIDACFVKLSDDGREYSFFNTSGRNIPLTDKNEAIGLCPTLVRLVITHMKHAERLAKCGSEHAFCETCEYGPLCASHLD